MLKNNSNHEQKVIGNFWFGFSLGVILGGGILFLLATKKGRKWLKKIIALAEEIENSGENFFKDLEEKMEEKKEVIAPHLASVLGKIKSAL